MPKIIAAFQIEVDLFSHNCQSDFRFAEKVRGTQCSSISQCVVGYGFFVDITPTLLEMFMSEASKYEA